jgi:integrase
VSETSYDVRIYVIDVYRGKRTTTHWVQWSVAGKRFKLPYKTDALAKSFRADLLSAAKRGEAFAKVEGLPVSLLRKETESTSWYDFVRNFVDMKWPDAAPTHRKSIADALAPITEAMIATDRGRPEHGVLRRALRVLFNTSHRDATQPEDVSAALEWLSRSTRPVSDLSKPDVLRKVIADFERKLDGKRAAPDTVRLRRTTFGNALDYAVEKELLTVSPLRDVKTKKHRTAIHQVDRRSVANPVQARTLLHAVRGIGRTGQKLVAFFALMYFAGLRPEETTNVRRGDLDLPPRTWNESDQCWEVHEWGVINLDRATPEVGGEWTDSGERSEERGLKHREDTVGRPVPCCPELALFLYEHLDLFGTGPDGRLFVAERGGRVGSSTYGRVWAQARKAAFTPEVVASPLAKRPYDLRHACLSMWLNAGVEATRVAEWAGNSLAVLLRVYAKCIDGGAQTAMQRVLTALGGRSESRMVNS